MADRVLLVRLIQAVERLPLVGVVARVDRARAFDVEVFFAERRQVSSGLVDSAGEPELLRGESGGLDPDEFGDDAPQVQGGSGDIVVRDDLVVGEQLAGTASREGDTDESAAARHVHPELDGLDVRVDDGDRLKDQMHARRLAGNDLHAGRHRGETEAGRTDRVRARGEVFKAELALVVRRGDPFDLEETYDRASERGDRLICDDPGDGPCVRQGFRTDRDDARRLLLAGLLGAAFRAPGERHREYRQ